MVCNKSHSAKRKKDDIASQSSYVHVKYDGECYWAPSFPWSESHCSMDVTWFPFDKQHCDLVYESWMYEARHVNLTTRLNADGAYERPDVYSDFQANDQWKLIGKSFLQVAVWYSGNGVSWSYQRSYSTLSPVSTGMGDRVRVRLPEAALYFGM